MRSTCSGGVRAALSLRARFSTAAAAPKPAAAASPAAAAPSSTTAAPPPPPPAPVYRINYSGRELPRYTLESPGGLSVDEARSLRVTSETASNYEGRKALIQHNSPSAWTSGSSQARGWSIKMTHSNKWSNQLMGWQSGDATVEQSCALLAFDTPEQAVLFCERNGWPYEVVAQPKDRLPMAVDPVGPGNNYNYNILPLAVMKGMKEAGAPRRAKAIFAHPAAPAATGVSTWVNWRHTGYGPDAWKPRNDKVKLDDSAWTGPEWRPSKDIPPPGAKEE